jgi:hypothetical protein
MLYYMRYASLALMLPLLVFCASSSRDNNTRQDDAKPPETGATGPGSWTDDISSYCVYYGTDQEERIKTYDLAVLEPDQYAPQQVQHMNRRTHTVGYLSIGETRTLKPGNGNGPGGNASWYMDQDGDGSPDQNPNWQSYFVDARDQAWHDHILQRAKVILDEQQFQGLFLDTVTTADRFPETKPGMIQLVRKLNRHYPDTRILLNHSPSVYPEVLSAIDGVLIESSFCFYDRERETYRERTDNDRERHLNRLKEIRNTADTHRDRLLFLGLDYAGPDDGEIADRCTRALHERGFIPYVSTLDLRGAVPAAGEMGVPGGE